MMIWSYHRHNKFTNKNFKYYVYAQSYAEAIKKIKYAYSQAKYLDIKYEGYADHTAIIVEDGNVELRSLK